MRILVPTYREINWILYIYAHLHVKYWGEKFTVMAEQEYINSDEALDGWWDFIKPPFKDAEITGGEYCETLKWTLNEIEDKFVTIMCADYLLSKPVNKQAMESIIEYMDANDNVLRSNLGTGCGKRSEEAQTDSYKELDIYEGNFLPTSLTPGIWNRELLVELMEKMEGAQTAWDFEIKGQDVFHRMGLRSVAFFPEPMHYVNAIRGRQNHELVMTQELYDEIGHMIPDNIAMEGIKK